MQSLESAKMHHCRLPGVANLFSPIVYDNTIWLEGSSASQNHPNKIDRCLAYSIATGTTTARFNLSLERPDTSRGRQSFAPRNIITEATQKGKKCQATLGCRTRVGVSAPVRRALSGSSVIRLSIAIHTNMCIFCPHQRINTLLLQY